MTLLHPRYVTSEYVSIVGTTDSGGDYEGYVRMQALF